MTSIHEASADKPILTRYEPGFRRFYAKGGLVSKDDEPDEMVRLAFWSSKDPVKLETEKPEQDVLGVGYRLEAEAILSVDAATRLRDLLTFWLQKSSEK